MRGRNLVGLLLAGFLLVALAIVWRRTIGIQQSETLTALDARKVQLEGERVRLESEIRAASSRQRLGSVAESRLGMRIPSDNQVVILPRKAQDAGP
jgi:cell division protein FtsL